MRYSDLAVVVVGVLGSQAAAAPIVSTGELPRFRIGTVTNAPINKLPMGHGPVVHPGETFNKNIARDAHAPKEWYVPVSETTVNGKVVSEKYTRDPVHFKGHGPVVHPEGFHPPPREIPLERHAKRDPKSTHEAPQPIGKFHIIPMGHGPELYHGKVARDPFRTPGGEEFHPINHIPVFNHKVARDPEALRKFKGKKLPGYIPGSMNPSGCDGCVLKPVLATQSLGKREPEAEPSLLDHINPFHVSPQELNRQGSAYYMSHFGHDKREASPEPDAEAIVLSHQQIQTQLHSPPSHSHGIIHPVVGRSPEAEAEAGWWHDHVAEPAENWMGKTFTNIHRREAKAEADGSLLSGELPVVKPLRPERFGKFGPQHNRNKPVKFNA